MRVAIYARKSTEEHQVESLETQLASARAFVASRDWTIATEIADTASGGEWARRRRPGVHKLLDGAREGLYQAVIARDDSRLGRDMLRTPLLLQDLLEAGVRVFLYSTGEELRIDDGTARLVATIRAYASEQERTAISSRTREALARRAEAGLVAGGTVYGYANQRGPDGVRRMVDERPAAIIREIFQRYADGEGLRAIAKNLTAREVPGPRGKAWVPSCLHAMLRRELYRGVVTWGSAAKVYRGGTRARTFTHERSQVTRIAPELRVIPEELWQRVATKIAGQTRSGPQPGAGAPPRYLLSGILRCANCKGPMTVVPGKRSHGPIRVYTCARHRTQGTCTSTLRREIGVVETAVLRWVSSEVLTERVIGRALELLRERVRREASAKGGERLQLEGEARRLRETVGKLADAAAEAPTGAREALFGRLSERQRELVGVEERLRLATHLPAALEAEVARLEVEARARLVDLRATLLDAPAESRALLVALFPAGLKAERLDTAEGIRMKVTGEAAPLAAFTNSASPAGFEPA